MSIKLKINFVIRIFRLMYILIYLFLFIFSINSCKDDPIVINPPVNNKDTVEQAQTPFENVPDIADIVMYEVNIKAFSNEGTLNAVTTGLDSVAALGVNVVWLMPIYPEGELNAVGSPYAVQDYLEVNPSFGTLDDLKKLVNRAHELDMAVILDWVANHTSWDNEWINNDGWYTTDASGNIESPNGWTDVADLNYNNQEMRQAMIDAMTYWVNTANIDGFRCDFADGVPADFWKKAINDLDTISGHQLIFFAEGTRKENFQAGFDLNFGWNVYGSLKGVISENKAVTTVYSANASDYSGIPAGKQMLHFITNHDDNAWDDTPDKLFKTQDGAMAAFVISAYLSGVPLIYDGQEIGYPNKLSFFTRTPINWSVNPAIRQEYKKLISIRRENDAVRGGSLKTYPDTDVAAFKRISDNGDEVLIIVNARNKAISYSLPADLVNTSWTDQMTQTDVQLGNELQLDAFQYLILK